MGTIFCAEFQRQALKFHTNFLTHTLKDVWFATKWRFKSSQIYEYVAFLNARQVFTMSIYEMGVVSLYLRRSAGVHVRDQGMSILWVPKFTDWPLSLETGIATLGVVATFCQLVTTI